jgi:hypothetical protein
MPESRPDGKSPSVRMSLAWGAPFGWPLEMLSWNRYQEPRTSVSPVTRRRSLAPRIIAYASAISSRVVRIGSFTPPSGVTWGRIVYA